MSERPLSPAERAAVEAAVTRDRSVSEADRRAHGVVHTPAPLARHVVESVDAALVHELGIAEGIASPRVTVIDPACGPGAFLAAVGALVQTRTTRPAALVGMDRDADALALARSILPSSWPLRFVEGDTLASLDAVAGLGLRADVVVVVGNPPWAGRSESRTELLERLLEDFRRDAKGVSLGERKIGVLSDVYVRFARWAAELVRRAPGGGVLGLVTNASYLDGPVHRGMRGALARWHDRVRVVDLGGSSLVAREAGDRDENVFGVRPSVAVLVASRRPARDEEDREEDRRAVVEVATLRGTRDAKLAALDGPLVYEPVEPTGPWRRGRGGASAWPEGWVALDALLPFHREGVQTNRDAVAVDRDRNVLLARLQGFALGLRDVRTETALEAKEHFDPEHARRALAARLAEDPEGTSILRPIAYRPFDRRWLAAVAPLCHRPRPDLLAAMTRSELALVTVRKDRGTRAWNHVAIVADVVDNCFLSSRSSCRSRAFPTHGPEGAENLSELGRAFVGDRGVRELLLHAATWLSSRTYRETFAELLAQDYPRIPPMDVESVALGERLAAAFLSDTSGPATEVTIGHQSASAPVALVEARAAIDAWVATRALS